MFILYRGHKDDNYLNTRYDAICFSEIIQIATGYGNGDNDSGNPAAADGFVTTVEFHGEIKDVREKANGNINPYIHRYRHYDAIRFNDGVVCVLKTELLRNPIRINALNANETFTLSK